MAFPIRNTRPNAEIVAQHASTAWQNWRQWQTPKSVPATFQQRDAATPGNFARPFESNTAIVVTTTSGKEVRI